MRISAEPTMAQPVEVVVGVHHRGESGLVDGGAERGGFDVAQPARPEHHLAVVQAAERSLPWPMKCLPQQSTPWPWTPRT